jgi:hypothetical protein
MDIRSKSTRTFVALVSLSLFSIACQRDGGPSPVAPSATQSASAATAQTLSAPSGQTTAARTAESSMNGAAGQMPAYFDGNLFTVNMKELSETASDSTIEKNPSINEIYATNDLDEEQDFIPVIDAIQGEGFNPLWRQILIVFNPGFTPHQFTSEEEVEAAAAAGEITLVETDEVYRCSVVATK